MTLNSRIVFYILIASSIIGCTKEDEKFANREITIFHTNDMHGRIVGGDNSAIGVDYIAGIKAANPSALLVDVGDTFHGLAIATIDEGEGIRELCPMAGYDLMTLGNHDFNYGLDRLKEIINGVESDGMQVVSSNVFYKANHSPLHCRGTIIERNGVKVGFIGLSTITTPMLTTPSNVEDLKFEEYNDITIFLADSLRSVGADIIVVLAHIYRNKSEELAASASSSIDLIIDGHEHITTKTEVAGIPIVQAGSLGKYVGCIKIQIDNNDSIIDVQATLLDKAEVYDTYSPVESVSSRIKYYDDKCNQEFEKLIGVSNVLLSSSFDPSKDDNIRTSEQAIGNFAADAIKEHTLSDMAALNSGIFKTDIKIGQIKRLDIVNLFPFNNHIVIKKVTPASLKEVLEISVGYLPESYGSFLQISGFEFTYNEKADKGNRIKSISINSKSVDLTDNSTNYTIAIPDYIAGGGDGYEVFTRIPSLGEGGMLEDVVTKHIQKHSPLTENNTGVYGRIKAHND